MVELFDTWELWAGGVDEFDKSFDDFLGELLLLNDILCLL
jgi:hypothetical protein